MRCSKCRSHGHNSARSKSCLEYKSTFEEKAVEEAVRQYGEGASTGIFTRKNYLDSSIRSVGIPANVKDDVKGYLTRCVEKARIITFLGSLLVGLFKYRRLIARVPPFYGKQQALYNEVCISYLLLLSKLTS